MVTSGTNPVQKPKTVVTNEQVNLNQKSDSLTKKNSYVSPVKKDSCMLFLKNIIIFLISTASNSNKESTENNNEKVIAAEQEVKQEFVPKSLVMFRFNFKNFKEKIKELKKRRTNKENDKKENEGNDKKETEGNDKKEIVSTNVEIKSENAEVQNVSASTGKNIKKMIDDINKGDD